MAVILKHPLAKIEALPVSGTTLRKTNRGRNAFIDAIDQKFHVLAEQPALGRSREELAEGLRLSHWAVHHFLSNNTWGHQDSSRTAQEQGISTHFFIRILMPESFGNNGGQVLHYYILPRMCECRHDPMLYTGSDGSAHGPHPRGARGPGREGDLLMKGCLHPAEPYDPVAAISGAALHADALLARTSP